MRRLMSAVVPVAFGIALGTAGCAKETEVRGPAAGATKFVSTLPGGRIPAGTTLWITLDRKIDDDTPVGSPVTARVAQQIMSEEGEVLVPKGARVVGRVTEVRKGRGREPGLVGLRFDHLVLAGERVPIEGEIVASDVPGDDRGVLEAITSKEALIGAAGGAVIGGVVEGLEGALVGGALGAGVGALISLGTGEREAELPAGTQLQVRTTRPMGSLATVRGRRVE